MRPLFKLSLFIVAFLAANACTEEELLDQNLNREGNSRLEVRLTDDPGDYEEVNVEIIGIELNTEEGWVSLDNVNTGIYDLLLLRDGVEVVLADEEIPYNSITEIRLMLGDDNTVKIDGKMLELTTPSAQQSGLKLKINKSLVVGEDLSILLDFDAGESVVKAGKSGLVILKPVIRVSIDGEEVGEDEENGENGEDDGEENEGDDEGDENGDDEEGDENGDDEGDENGDNEGDDEGGDNGEDSGQGEEHKDDGEEHKDDGDEHKDDGEENKDDGDEHKDDGEEHKDDGEEHKDDGEENKDDGEENKDDGEENKDDGEENKDDGEENKDDGEEHKDDGEEHKDEGDEHKDDGEEHKDENAGNGG